MARLSSRRLALLLALVAALVTTTAFAHPGHAGMGHGGFVAGLLHPLLGMDHLLAIAAIGLWSARQATALKRFVPLTMLAGMWGGAGLAWSGMTLPGVETGIAISVLLAGILIASLATLPRGLGATLVAAFMVFHGYAHGSELPANASLLTYLIGFSLTTLTIAVVSRYLGSRLCQREGRWSRVIGLAIATLGGVFAVT